MLSCKPPRYVSIIAVIVVVVSGGCTQLCHLCSENRVPRRWHNPGITVNTLVHAGENTAPAIKNRSYLLYPSGFERNALLDVACTYSGLIENRTRVSKARVQQSVPVRGAGEGCPYQTCTPLFMSSITNLEPSWFLDDALSGTDLVKCRRVITSYFVLTLD